MHGTKMKTNRYIAKDKKEKANNNNKNWKVIH